MSEAAESTETPPGETVDVDRMCGRCRQLFAADPHQVEGTIADWWLCDRCRVILLGEDGQPPDRTVGT